MIDTQYTKDLLDSIVDGITNVKGEEITILDLREIENAKGISVIEAARGSLYHNIFIEKGKIQSYDVITPTVWNLGPENKKQKGVAQKAIIGSSSIEIAKIILRSFDVCSVCTTH